MPVIRVDDEVMQKLQAIAIEEGLVFGTPNAVLRVSLGIDNNSSSPKDVESVLSVTSQGEDTNMSISVREPSLTRRVTGRSLMKEHPGLNQHLKPYADRDGTFYQWPRAFPAVLFDEAGYVILKSEQSMVNSPLVDSYPDTQKIHIQKGITSLPGYIKCNHSHRRD